METTPKASLYPIDAALSKRIDNIRVILTIFIIYIHIYNINDVSFADGNFQMMEQPLWLSVVKQSISLVIARVGVPLFFLISSILLYSKPFTFAENMKKKCRAILIPYLFWNTFWILFFFTAQSISFTQPFFATRIIREYSAFKFFACYIPIPGVDASPFCYPLWFLFDLFTLNALSKVIKALADRLPVLFTSACAIAWLFNLELYIISPEALMFFLLGYFIVKNRWSIKKIDSLALADLSAAWLLSVFVAAAFLGTYPILLKASILIGILFFIRLSETIAARKNWLGKLIEFLIPYTFMIYVSHEFTMTILKKLVVRLLPQTYAIQLAEYLIIPLVIVVICTLWGMAFKKTLPKAYKLFTGNR